MESSLENDRNLQRCPSKYRLRNIKPSDLPNVLEHLTENFYLDEPVNRMFGISSDRIEDYNLRITHMVQIYPRSLCVYESESPDKIVGVLIIAIHDLQNPLPVFQPKSPITARFMQFLEQLESSFDIRKHFEVSAFPELAILSICKTHRGNGLATELYRQGIAQLFNEDYPLVYSEYSNPISRKLGAKLGFKEVSRFLFSQFKPADDFVMPDYSQNEKNYVSLSVLEKKDVNNKCTCT